VAFPPFATISLTDFLLTLGVADTSILVDDDFDDAALAPALVVVTVCGFGVSLGDVVSVVILALAVRSCLTTALRTGSPPAACEAADALPVAALAKAGVSAGVPTTTALGLSAGRCASIAADVVGVDSGALIPASGLPTCL
jgi:hypothetical protein